MSKRFGRNQRRKMRQQIEQIERDHDHAVFVAANERERLLDRIDRLNDRLKNSIEFDIRLLESPADRAMDVRVTMDAMGRDRLGLVQRVDDRELMMIGRQPEAQIEFVRHVATMIAEKLLHGIQQRWRR